MGIYACLALVRLWRSAALLKEFSTDVIRADRHEGSILPFPFIEYSNRAPGSNLMALLMSLSSLIRRADGCSQSTGVEMVVETIGLTDAITISLIPRVLCNTPLRIL